MSKSKYSWELNTGEDEWNDLVERSPQGNIFSNILYLELCGAPHAQFMIRQGAELKAGVCVTLSADGGSCVLDDLVIHNGILFNPGSKNREVKRRLEEFSLTEFAINNLVDTYHDVRLSLSPQVQDLRPFLWHNYHESDRSSKFSLDLRYTSYVNIAELKFEKEVEEYETFWNMETVRRQQIRKAIKCNAITNLVADCSVVIGHYQELMKKQGEPVDSDKLVRMTRLINGLVEANRCAIYQVQDSEQEILYSVVYCWDAHRAYYLFGAGNPSKSAPWQGTLAHWDAFRDLARRVQLDEVDLEGVNSPQRGWFKQGLGGDLRHYFHVFMGGAK